MPSPSSTRPPLHPHYREVYGASLRPPPDTVFDGGIATTYSLDFPTALVIPATLALYAAENKSELLRNPMAMLRGIEHTAVSMAVFCQAGRIHAEPKRESRLCALLERIVVEARAPRGGEFHPKIWALRFRPIDPAAPTILRLLVLSRNLTRDHSWDLCLCLDGELGDEEQSGNQVLAAFIRDLPQYAVEKLPDHVTSLSETMASDLVRVKWRVPAPFRSISFSVHGIGQREWQPQRCTNLGVVSPFCSERTLNMLANLAPKQRTHLVGRAEELDRVRKDVLKQFGRVSMMHEDAETDEGEDIENLATVGLHAKAYVQQAHRWTQVTLGSANATSAALQDGRNVEVLATLSGPTMSVGTVAKILGPEGLGQVLVEYARKNSVDTELDAAQTRLDEARREIVGAGLSLCCSREEPNAPEDTRWRMTLQSEARLCLHGITSVEVWPVTRGKDHGREAADALRSGDCADLGTMALADMSRFIAFSLRDLSGRAELTFALCLGLNGAPEDRDAAALRWLIDSPTAFLRYLRLLLADMSDPISAQTAARMSGGTGAGGQTADEPILEELVHALCDGRERLQAIEKLIHRLQGRSNAGEADVVPREFLAMWRSFQEALKMSK